MNEKVKLPKAVCDALDEIISNEFIPSEIVVRTFNAQWKEKIRLVLNSFDVEIIMRALVLGYETEMTAEEKAKDLFHTDFDFGCMEQMTIYRNGMRDFANAHDIHYDWLEDDIK